MNQSIMKIDYKSLFLGVLLGVIGIFSFFYLFGNIETEFSFTIGKPEKKIDKTLFTQSLIVLFHIIFDMILNGTLKIIGH